MPKNYESASVNRLDVAVRQVAVGVVRYIERLVLRGYNRDQLDKSDQEKFRHSAFRIHTENVVELIDLSLSRYSDDLLNFVLEELLNTDTAKKEGDRLYLTIPFSEKERARWMERVIAKWKANYRVD